MYRDPSEFRNRFKAYKNGKSVREIYDGGYIKEPVITPDTMYNEYINSLPDNQRLTPESSYRSHRYWELNGKPKNFAEAVGKGMFTYDFTDNKWHAKSVTLNEKTGEYEFMKPNWHDTKMYEDAWYYSKNGEQFRNQYTKKVGVAYDRYIPKYRNSKLPGYSNGKFDSATKKKIDYYYKLLRNNGFDMMSAVGILGNMMQESSLDPNIVNHLGYHGLLQNSKAIQNAIKNQYGDLSEQSQLRYLSDWTDGVTWIRKGPYASDTALYSKSYLRSGYKTPEQAAYEFLKRYERAIVVDPKTKKALRDANGNYIYQDKDKRLGYAKSIYNYLSGRPDGMQDQIAQVGATQPEPIIAMPDATRVSTIPTIQQQAVDYSDHRNQFAAEAERAIWARNVMDSLQEGYKVPVWESPSLPALQPVEMDVAPFKTYSSGKLAGYQGGKEATIQQGRKQLPIDKAEAATEPDYNEGWLLTTLKRGANNFIKTVKDQVRSARNIVNGRGDWFDWLNVGTDVVLGAGGKAVKGAAKEAKAAAKAIKPKKSSVKFNTKDPNKVGSYYTAHPEEITPITNSEELNDVVNFINTHIAPKYARQNKVHIGIDPADIKLGSADLSGTNLGGYVGPSGEVVINQDILNNSDLLRRVLGHEVAGHWLDLHYPLTPAQASIVQNGVRFNADFLNSRPWFDQFAEGNAERRLFNYLSSRDNGNVVGSELDAIINSMPRAQAKRYADMLGYNKGIEWQWPDILPFKQAATSVPTIGIPLYASTQIDRQYKNGKLPGYSNGKIRINPANRCKFNATKKRTGKTTEELTHSKNPLTRKRAIFAQNARKWNHK